jgi:hypothetical protein
MGQPGQGDIRERVADLEHQFRRLKGDSALNVAHIKGEFTALVNHEQLVDIWAQVRKIEKRFHWVQGNYHVRISSMQAATNRCKRQMQKSIVSDYSSASTGRSFPAPRYQDDRASGCDPTLTASMYGNFGDVQHGTYEGSAFAHGTAEYLYAPSEPLIPLAPLLPMVSEYLYFPDEPFMTIEPPAVYHVYDSTQSYASQHAHDTRSSFERTFDRV